MNTKSLLKKFIKTKPAKKILSFVISKAQFLIPRKKLLENSTWVAYTHPNPSYPVHIVILPKKEIGNWMEMTSKDGDLYCDFIEISQRMIRDFQLDQAGYRLIMNGGRYQTFSHLHFHLVAGDAYNT
jgi:histidine triad (HIT) family protein